MAAQKRIMTKNEMFKEISQVTGIKLADVKMIMLAAQEIQIRELNRAGEVKVNNGKIVKKKRPARIAINPMTKAKVKVPAKTVLKFRFSKAFKEQIISK